MAKTLRVYDNYCDGSGYYIPYEVAKLLKLNHSQGTIYVTGYTKADALATLDAVLGYKSKPNGLRIGSGNTLNALVDAGQLVEPGTVLITAMTSYSDVFKVTPDGTHLIGEVRPASGHRAEFVPVVSE